MDITTAKASTSKRSKSSDDDVDSDEGMFDGPGEGPLKRTRISINNCSTLYRASGLKHSLHGNIYQLKLLMLFLHRGLCVSGPDGRGYTYRLATEMDAAEKFDDLVFQYESEDRDKIINRYLQAKHKQDEYKNKIKSVDLLNSNEGEFSLPKYFRSYRKIINNAEFSNAQNEFKDFIVCTNIDFDLEDLKNVEIEAREITEPDEFLSFDSFGSDKKSVLYNLFVKPEHELMEKLRETSDLHVLVKKLVEKVLKNKPLDLKVDIFRQYHVALGKQIIDIGKKKFYDDFLKRDSKLSEEKEVFRNAVLKQLATKKTDWETFVAETLKLSGTFGKDVNPIIEVKIFAQKLNELIISAKKSGNYVVDICNDKYSKKAKSGSTEKIVYTGILNLAEYVLVNQENAIKFRSEFLDLDFNFPANFDEFRNELKVALENANFNFNDLKLYEFLISGYKTCTEEKSVPKSFLPKDVVDDDDLKTFFEKLVFAVNQPNEVELGNAISREIGEEFNLLDADLVTDNFERKVLDWMKAKEGVYLSSDEAKTFFSEGRDKIAKLVIIGPTSEYCSKLKETEINFKNTFKELNDFLINVDTKQIFNLISQSTKLGALNVYQALNSTEYITKNDSFIFINYTTFVRMTDWILKAFRSESISLLIIEFKENKYKQENDDLIHNILSDIMFTNPDNFNKKIVLLTKEGNNLANKFKLDNYNKDKYCEKIDNTIFKDLTIKSQNKLLEKMVNFQGFSLRFNELIAENSKNLIDLETFLKLVNNEDVIIGNSIHDDKCEHYIDRNLCCKVEISKDIIDDEKFQLFSEKLVVNDNADEMKRDDSKDVNVHWLAYESERLIWQKSSGSISSLVKYRKENSDFGNNVISEIKILSDEKMKILIISDVVGAGKSALLTNLNLTIKAQCPSIMVIRLNLNQYNKVFKEEYEFRRKQKRSSFNKNNVDEAVNFLRKLMNANDQSKLNTELENEIFNLSFRCQKLVLMLDEFDEIAILYKDIAIDLTRELAKSSVKKMIIVTKPSFKEDLEVSLGVFAYNLELFSKTDQISFLVNFWMKRSKLSDEKRVEIYARKLLIKLRNYVCAAEFSGTPLQLKRVGEIFEKEQELKDISISKEESVTEFCNSLKQEPQFLDKQNFQKFYAHFIDPKKCQMFSNQKVEVRTATGKKLLKEMYAK